jgi:hypothetical protein
VSARCGLEPGAAGCIGSGAGTRRPGETCERHHAWLDPATAPFLPIPEIDVDPQSGVTVGLIAAFLRVNDRGEIERITAPDVFHSQYFGWGAGISQYGFPSEDSQWLVIGSVKQQNLIATGAELRTLVAGFDAFGTRVALELAPFVDAGKVFANGPGNALSEMHTTAGLGMRGVATPYVVGYVDVGYGRGKAVVFSGINYPF